LRRSRPECLAGRQLNGLVQSDGDFGAFQLHVWRQVALVAGGSFGLAGPALGQVLGFDQTHAAEGDDDHCNKRGTQCSFQFKWSFEQALPGLQV